MDRYFSIESGVGDPPEETESTDDLWASSRVKSAFARWARYWLYRIQILQENMSSKALAETYTMHSFESFLESIIENWGTLHRSLILIFSVKIAELFADFRQKS